MNKEAIEDMIEKMEEYQECLDEIIQEKKCKDCGNWECRMADRGLCRLYILNDLKENIGKLI